MSASEWAWCAGGLVPLADAGVALADPGFLLGDGVFETLRARRGVPFAWPLHRARLRRGLAVLSIDPAALATAEEAVFAVAASAAAAIPGDLYLRVQVVRAAAEAASAPGVVTASARPCPHYPAHLYRPGARLGLARGRRDPSDPLAGVKSLSYLPQVLARRAARAAGWDDALVLNTGGRVCEGAFGNVIARRGRELFAPGPKEGALDGVTRRLLLQEAAGAGYALRETLEWDALCAAEEVVLVSTLAGVVPVVRIEDTAATFAGAEGGLARELAAAYETLLDAETASASGTR